MTYYKVTTTELNSLAVSQNFYAQEFVVKYEPNAWVHPNHKQTKLFVFEDYSQALAWAKGQSCEDYNIWECEVLNPTTEYALFVDGVYSRGFAQRLKDVLENGQIRLHLMLETPPSTVFVDAVKLTKFVDSSEDY